MKTVPTSFVTIVYLVFIFRVDLFSYIHLWSCSVYRPNSFMDSHSDTSPEIMCRFLGINLVTLAKDITARHCPENGTFTLRYKGFHSFPLQLTRDGMRFCLSHKQYLSTQLCKPLEEVVVRFCSSLSLRPSPDIPVGSTLSSMY